MFCVRCGTARGVLVYWLRSETHRDMAAWARSLVQGSHQAVNYQREFSFRCLFQGRQCQLVVHINRGFFLYDCGGFAPTTPTVATAKTQLWQFAFDKLKGSADDGARMLYLDFGEDGEIVSASEKWDTLVNRDLIAGTGHGVLSQAGCLRRAQLPVGQSSQYRLGRG